MTSDEIWTMTEISSMWRMQVKWLDNDRCEHSTVVYTSFEITDEAADLLLEAHGKAIGMDIDSPLTQEITPPVGLE